MSSQLSQIQTHTCGNCGKVHSYPAALQYRIFVCPDCHSYFEKEGGDWQKRNTCPAVEWHPIALGMQAVFDGETYTVAGYAELNTPEGYYETRWHEYFLFGEKGARAFLSETNGHWVFLKEMADLKALNIQSRQIFLSRDQKLHTFKKIHRYATKCESAIGFFDFPLFAKASAEEAIKLPEHLIIEKRGKDKHAFLGYYVKPHELKAAFQQELELPLRYGTGTSQSFYFNHHFYIILLIAGFAIGFINLLSNITLQEETLVEHRVDIQDSSWQNRVVTPSFEISGRTSPVEVLVKCPGLNNDWLSFDVALINEKTGEAFYTEVGLEYYSGVDEDGHWTEGKMSNSFTICSVPPGTYNAAFKLYKSSLAVPTIYLTLKRGHAYMANGFTCMLICLIICAVVYISQLYFEKNRWEGASYTQY
jgi:hypothetical protein